MATFRLKVDLTKKPARALMAYIKDLAQSEQSIQVEEETEDVPNKTTAKAMADADKGRVKRFGSVDDLMNDLED